jgi:crossover junction endodeoxyribonuclease RusA
VIELFLTSLPPSTNAIWRRSGRHIHKSSKYQSWLSNSGKEIVSQKPGRINGPYVMSAQFLRPDKRKRDLSNLIKSLEDLLVSMNVIEDDSHAEMISLRWVTSGAPVTVHIQRAGDRA